METAKNGISDLENLGVSAIAASLPARFQYKIQTIAAKSSWNTHALLRFSGSFPFSVLATGVETPSPRQTMLSR